jgi:hypothetical protein
MHEHESEARSGQAAIVMGCQDGNSASMVGQEQIDRTTRK